ncbi:NADP-dependent oxidoreductase domain-containing protein [Bisporella sp. PMI_857]|nr:NADP-dependent oxidoreductase domain-containing protein [Bisporella sp. PMI_857]
MVVSILTCQLGKNRPHVTVPGPDCVWLSAFYGKPESDKEPFKFLDHAYSIGARFWDSADVYTTRARDKIFLATKSGGPIVHGKFAIRSDTEYRLGVDKIDLCYMHCTGHKTPFENTVEAMVQLKNEGRCPLGRGILTVQYNSAEDFEKRDSLCFLPRFSKENFSKIKFYTNEYYRGTKKTKYLDGNTGAAKAFLSKSERKSVRKLVDSADVHRIRYGPNTDTTMFANTPSLY